MTRSARDRWIGRGRRDRGKRCRRNICRQANEERRGYGSHNTLSAERFALDSKGRMRAAIPNAVTIRAPSIRIAPDIAAGPNMARIIPESEPRMIKKRGSSLRNFMVKARENCRFLFIRPMYSSG